jgi:hypothetical protein
MRSFSDDSTDRPAATCSPSLPITEKRVLAPSPSTACDATAVSVVH